jgi:hypothetical protein
MHKYASRNITYFPRERRQCAKEWSDFTVTAGWNPVDNRVFNEAFDVEYELFQTGLN